MIKNTGSQVIGAQLITAADGTAFTGAVTVYVCGDAGSQALGSVGSGVCTHEGNGYHTYAPAQAETNYDLIAFTFIGSGAIPVTVQVFTQIAQQTGDSFARIGATGSGLTSLAPASEYDTEMARITANVATETKQDLQATVAICTEARLAELDAANLPADIDAILADTSVLGEQITLTGTANAGDTTVKITLTGGVATDNYYNGQLVIITGGTGVGQARTILKYIAAGTAATPTRDFAVAPDDTSTFVVVGADIATLLEAGVAQAGGVATVTLDATASGTTDIYVNNFIMIAGGTGVGQTRLIGLYDGGTKVATILPNWTTVPDNTSIYQILPMARVDIQGWLGNVVTGDGDWAALKAETALIVADTNELQTDDTPGALAAIDGKIDTAQADLDIITAADGVNLTAATQASIDAIEADTDEIQQELADGGRLDLILDATLADTDELQTNQGNWLTATGFMLDTEDGSSFSALNDITAAEVKTAMEATGSDLDYLIKALVNKAIWTEADGALEMFNDADGSLGSIAAQVSTDGTYTTRKRTVK